MGETRGKRLKRSSRGRSPGEEQKVYDAAPVNYQSGELQIWDSVLYPSVIRKRQFLFLEEALAEHNPRTVLDAGCGPGWMMRYISDRGFSVIGVDISRTLVFASQSAAALSMAHCLADASELPFANASVDCIVSVATLHHLSVEKALREWRRIIKKDGCLVLFEPNQRNLLARLGRRFFPTETHTETEEAFTPEELRNALTATGWEIHRWQTQILFAFAVSRLLYLMSVPESVTRVVVPHLDRLESLMHAQQDRAQNGWIIAAVCQPADP